jgi:hypothetical protein
METRSKGGQPGNINAQKHGFYSKCFTLRDRRDLDQFPADLSAEIDLQRVLIRKVYTFANRNATSLTDWIATLNALGASTTRLAGLLRAQKLLGEATSDLDTAISNALLAAQQDFGIM